jgi:hypothetical protein
VRTILGFTFRPTHHSTMRQYYLSRNRIVVFRKYVTVFPRWAFLSLWESTREKSNACSAKRTAQ